MNTSVEILNNLNEAVLVASDATDEFITELKDLLNKHCRVDIGSMTLEDGGNTVNIDRKKVDITADSNLAAILDIANFLLK